MSSLDVMWHGFRGFGAPTRLSFPRVTVLIGRNNVGKTSAYMPLLLMRQTLDAKDPNTALLSRGPLVDVGPYHDFVHMHDQNRTVEFSVSYPQSPPPIGLSKRTDPILGQLDLGFSATAGLAVTPILSHYRLSGLSGQVLIDRKWNPRNQTYDVKSSILPAAKTIGRPLREVTALRKSLREEMPTGFLFDGVAGLTLPREWRENAERWSRVREWFGATSELYWLHQSANAGLQKLLRQIAYLGPLRSLPSRTYRLAAEAPQDVGREGEYAPELLFRAASTGTEKKINEWLTKLGYGQLEFTELGQEYFQLNMASRDGLSVNIAHSGVGLSQLLPLLVQGLLVESTGTFIAQQPEIHLNPAQQGVVVDFLLEEVAANGARVIVETHSEHTLLRLRRRLAEGTTDLKGSDVALYFVDNVDGLTQIDRIPIGDHGEIERVSWPKGFFEEQLEDSFALAIAQSRAVS